MESYPKVAQQFREFFHADLHPLLDARLSHLRETPILDLYRFDDFLQGRFGDYEEQGYSMQELIQERYGAEAAYLVQALIGA